MTGFRNDQKAEELYKLYQDGFSLDQIGKMHGVTRQSIFKIFTCRGWALRKKKALPFIIWNGIKYTLGKRSGYYASTKHPKKYLHRDMWIAVNGPIPEGFEVHHKNENKEDNRLDNFDLLTTGEHAKFHSKHNVGFQRN